MGGGGVAAKRQIAKLEALLRSIVLRTTINAPWYVRNDELREDLRISSVVEEIIHSSGKYKSRLDNHPNDLTTKLYTVNLSRRLHTRHTTHPLSQ